MNYEEYLAKRRQDPEYREVERQLKPILDLADDVFNLRMKRGWTQAELAERVGTKQANISRLENGSANPTFKFLQKLSEVFETDLVVRLQPQSVKVQARPTATWHTDVAAKWSTKPKQALFHPSSGEVVRLWFPQDVWEQMQEGLVPKASSETAKVWDWNPPAQPPCVA